MNEHFDVKKPCTNSEVKCSKSSAKCISVLSGFSLSFYNLPISQHHLYLVKKLHNSLGRNLASYAVLKPFLLSLGRGGTIPEFVIFHTILGAFLWGSGNKSPDSAARPTAIFQRKLWYAFYIQVLSSFSVRKMASFLMRSKLVYYVVVFRQQKRCTSLLIPSFGGRICHHMAPIESRYFHYVRHKTHNWGLQIMWTQEKKNLRIYEVKIRT